MGYEKKVHPCSCILNKPAHLNEMTVETVSWAFAALASPHLRWFSHSKHVFFPFCHKSPCAVYNVQVLQPSGLVIRINFNAISIFDKSSKDDFIGLSSMGIAVGYGSAILQL